MVTLADARIMVATVLEEWNQGNSGPEAFVILDECTIERSWGWVFFYTSKGWCAGDANYAIAGNAPLIVGRFTGAMHSTGTARPIEHYIENYELTGNPHTRPGSQVAIEASDLKSDVIGAVKLLREFSELSFAHAKHGLDEAAQGRAFVVQAANSSDAHTLCGKLRSLGFICQQQTQPAV
jgi:hypothetical protein